MNKFKYNDQNFTSYKEKLLLNENNNQYQSYFTCQNIYQNPLNNQPNSNNDQKNNLNITPKIFNQRSANNNLNITPIEPELTPLNYTFPNQLPIENNIYNDISEKHMIKNKSSNNIKDEILKEYKSLSEDNDDQLNEIAINIKENEDKIDNMAKRMNLLINQKKEENIIDAKSLFSQVNDIEKLQQENITLKADSIIFREDISNLVQSNEKYTQDLEIARKKIMELIDKCNEIEKEINHKEFQIDKLNEILARLRLYENQDVEFKIINNKSKDEVLHEIEYNVKIGKDENNKLIKDKKILEEKIQNLIENKNDFNRNNIINNERENKIINELEEKIRILEKGIMNLNDQNNILNINNTNMEKELENLYADKKNYEEKYNKENEEFEKLQLSYNNLYNKYQHVLIESNKKIVKKEIIKRNKSEKNLKKNKSVINELYNKIQILKTKVKNDRNIESNLI